MRERVCKRRFAAITSFALCVRKDEIQAPPPPSLCLFFCFLFVFLFSVPAGRQREEYSMCLAHVTKNQRQKKRLPFARALSIPPQSHKIQLQKPELKTLIREPTTRRKPIPSCEAPPAGLTGRPPASSPPRRVSRPLSRILYSPLEMTFKTGAELSRNRVLFSCCFFPGRCCSCC